MTRSWLLWVTLGSPSQGSFPEAAPAPSPEAPETPPPEAVNDAVAETTVGEPPKAPEPHPAPAALAGIDMSQERESSKAASESRPEKPRLQRTVWGVSLRFGGTFASEDLLTASYTDGSHGDFAAEKPPSNREVVRSEQRCGFC